MNPLLIEALGSIVRAALNIGAGWLVAHGIWSSSDAEKYVGALAIALLTLGWSIWQKHGMRAKLVTAMAMPAGVSENQVQAAVSDPHVLTPPVTLPKDAVAYPMARPPEPPKAA